MDARCGVFAVASRSSPPRPLVELAPGKSAVVWRSSFLPGNEAAAKNGAQTIEAMNDFYGAGLINLEQMLERG